MIRRLIPLLNLFLILTLLLAACNVPTTTPEVTATTVKGTEQPKETAAPVESTAITLTQPTNTLEVVKEQPLYLSIIWHQHQPVYFKDPETGVYAKPWVRVHATKDYVDMAAMLEKYPNIHVTFNLTPSLIRQLDDLQAGAKDLYWVTAEIPADQLTDVQKQFLRDRFFDTNRKIIARFPRYQELLMKRDSSGEFSTQDYLDLQVLFNLAWVDPDWLANEPLASLVVKGSNFSEDDKKVIFNEHKRLIAEVIPIHKKLQDAGQIEVTMTPFAHPILPLLVSLALAKEALPNIELPARKFNYVQDARAQVELGVKLYEDHFGRSPRGMWPAEGSVAQEIVSIASEAGIQWMASDEGVLARSLGMTGFTRDTKEVVTEPDMLYRPYYVQGGQSGPVAMVFRDVVISDKVGFAYSGMKGSQAAQDFIDRVHAIRNALKSSGAKGPYLVSVILDGENAWENYDNDGKEFLNNLYAGLSNDLLVKTVTPSEFLKIAPERSSIKKLWAGSWINHDFSTWIGEDEENRAWEYLADTRDFLQKYISGVFKAPSAEALEQAKTLMYIAEGSDWFWWYGADQNSGNDEAFDQQFRNTLKQVYTTLGEKPPVTLDVPIIPLQAVEASQASTALLAPKIDGVMDAGEWDAAGVYEAVGGVMASANPYFQSLAYGFDKKNLCIKIQSGPNDKAPAGESSVEIYLSSPGSKTANNFSRNGTLLGFPANRLVEISFTDGKLAGVTLYSAAGSEEWNKFQNTIGEAAMQGNILELAIPLSVIDKADTGDRISMRVIYTASMGSGDTRKRLDTDQIPGRGPAVVSVPDLGTMTVILDIKDPENDDHAPGNYTYPTDAVFKPGNFDILNFQVGIDDQNIIFKFAMRGPVENPWGSGNGLSVQTFDIYIDKDSDGKGGVAMLPGRNLAFQQGYAWDYAITAEGWEAGIFTPGDKGPQKVATASQFTILTDPVQQKVTIKVPKSILGDNPQAWRYAAVVLGQDGYPAGGVLRVRDVNPEAAQWRFGGAPAGSTNHTRVIDFVWAASGEQEIWISDFTPVSGSQTALTEANFARVPMIEAPK